MSAIRLLVHTVGRRPVLAGVIIAVVLPIIASALHARWHQWGGLLTLLQ